MLPSAPMSRPPTALLGTRAQEGARRLALRSLDDAVEQATRLLGADDDPQALHDLRVALRKLRTVLRSHRPLLRQSLRRKRVAELRAWVARTGAGRDTEVQLAWLVAQLETLGPRERRGSAWLRARLVEQKRAAYDGLRTEVLPGLLSLLPNLRRKLSHYTVEHDVFGPEPDARFESVTAALLRAQAEAMATALSGVHGPQDEARAHEGRIHGKRLRYLLEPLRDELDEADAQVRALKGLQDLLGELNDVAVRIASFRGFLEALALERAHRLSAAAEGDTEGTPARAAPEEERFLLALVRRSHQRRLEIFEALEVQWSRPGGALDRLMRGVDALADTLEARGASEGGLPREIERKYLLDGLPPEGRGPSPIEIDQGYLPGQKLIERVRRTRDADGERYFRTIKLGKGLSRIEVEEETDRPLFTKLWSLTKGRRVRKRRHRIEHGGRLWELDEFLDRPLFLAEVELPSEDAEVVLPPWLSPHVVREVTDEAEYVNARLAR